jgi:DNA-binding transcriptional regulator YiaG
VADFSAATPKPSKFSGGSDTPPVGCLPPHDSSSPVLDVIAFRQLRRYPTAPKTLGEHLRKKREDMQLSMTQLAKTLGLGIADAAIEKWEKNQDRPTDEHRKCIVEFLGFNPARTNPTGGF